MLHSTPSAYPKCLILRIQPFSKQVRESLKPHSTCVASIMVSISLGMLRRDRILQGKVPHREMRLGATSSPLSLPSSDFRQATALSSDIAALRSQPVAQRWLTGLSCYTTSYSGRTTKLVIRAVCGQQAGSVA